MANTQPAQAQGNIATLDSIPKNFLDPSGYAKAFTPHSRQSTQHNSLIMPITTATTALIKINLRV